MTEWLNWYIYIIYIVIPVSHCYTAETVWNLEFQNTPLRTLKTVEYVYYTSESKENQFPTRNPDVSEAQFYTPCYVIGYMLATSLLYMTEFYYKEVLGEQTIKVKGGGGWGDNDYTSRGDVSMVNLTGAAWPQLHSPFAICREGSLQETRFSLVTVSSLFGRVQAQFTPCL